MSDGANNIIQYHHVDMIAITWGRLQQLRENSWLQPTWSLSTLSDTVTNAVIIILFIITNHYHCPGDHQPCLLLPPHLLLRLPGENAVKTFHLESNLTFKELMHYGKVVTWVKKVVNFGNWFLCQWQFSPKTYKVLHGAFLTPQESKN